MDGTIHQFNFDKNGLENELWNGEREEYRYFYFYPSESEKDQMCGNHVN